MHTTLTFQAIEEGTADEDLASIRTTANRIMEAHEKTAGTWITTGKELKRLKATLVKDTPRGDNTRIGWVKAFDLEPPELPFGRRMAEMIIAVHDFFDGTQVPLKNLPGSWKALYYLAAKVNDIALIEKLIAEQRITPLSTESDLRKLDELRNRPKRKGSRIRHKRARPSGTTYAMGSKASATCRCLTTWSRSRVISTSRATARLSRLALTAQLSG